MSAKDRTQGYATALLEVAQAEGALEQVSDELFSFEQTLSNEPKLRDAVTDPNLPADHRSQMLGDLLGAKAHPTTVHLVRFIVEAGRAREMPAIIEAFVAKAAEARQHVVAEVRSAVALDAKQREALTAALEHATGKTLELKVAVDPDVIGGFVARVGDVIYDASVRRRLATLQEKIGSR
jgi:F-type H+-transporting ATPase subunit delta